jgi:APA family basic amino acid/polyamine antiporter
MAAFLPGGTWWRLLIWSAIGIALYFGYGYKNSKLRARNVAMAGAATAALKAR